MKKYLITIHHNKSHRTHYENLTAEIGSTEMRMYYQPEKGYNAFTEFVYQKALAKDKTITPEQSLQYFPITNIFELCM